jgi:protein-disulfide isomerase
MNATQLKVPIRKEDHHRGPLNAPIKLVEYGDFECPHCGKAFYELEQVVQDMGDKMCFVYRHFPLREIHPHAEIAALASEAAHLQGKFWEMHHLIFQNQDGLSEQTLLYFAQMTGMDMNRFKTDIQRPEVAEKVKNDFMGGIRSGVNGTPTVFLNGYRFNFPVTYDNIVGAIQELVASDRPEEALLGR